MGLQPILQHHAQNFRFVDFNYTQWTKRSYCMQFSGQSLKRPLGPYWKKPIEVVTKLRNFSPYTTNNFLCISSAWKNVRCHLGNSGLVQWCICICAQNALWRISAFRQRMWSFLFQLTLKCFRCWYYLLSIGVWR